jgi:murein DD-endopeptidase MepM/ murein hydrolase activator NlpD
LATVAQGRKRVRRAASLGALCLLAAFGAVAFGAIRGDEARQPSARVPPAVAIPPPVRNAARTRRFRASDRLAWPLHGKVTSAFGELRAGHAHEGIDIPMPVGTPIRAAASGRVIVRGLEQGYGKYTCIAHRTISTCYAHQSRFGTKLGARVRRGEVIGFVGSTGDASAYHLHFEVRRGTRPWGTPVDPEKFLPSAEKR